MTIPTRLPMKSEGRNSAQELYRQLRVMSCDQLWEHEVPRFDRGTPKERMDRVAVIRAVGVVFSESGTAKQRDDVRPWLRRLLQDPNEKIRRYAMAALPKIGAGQDEEAKLLSLLQTTTLEREKKFLGRTLEKIGGIATLREMEKGTTGFCLQTGQKIKASLARDQSPSSVKMDGILPHFRGLRIHLHVRQGLEQILHAEVEEYIRVHGKFRIVEVRSARIAITPVAPFCMADIFTLRCFGTVGFVLGSVNGSIEALASVITSLMSRRILQTFTDGSIRYRLEFEGKGHQRAAVRLLASRVYARCPEILNDARHAPWSVAIHSTGQGSSVELCPRLTDPRFSYRQDDVPAASHPPLAACMARLAGRVNNEVVWDPFCGSGLELVERALLGGVRSIYGTDVSAEAVAIAGKNFAAANVKSVQTKFTCCDFREIAMIGGLGSNVATLIITNPPMGKRVPIPNLRGLIDDLFSVAATVLTSGGRLVFVNPFRMETPQRSLKLEFRQMVDFGGFDCRLEMYRKLTR